jgi:hypothetical protein
MRRYISVALTVALLLAVTSYAEPRRLGGLGVQGVPVGVAFTIPFCGNGGNNAIVYISPQLGMGQELIPGSADCDGMDHAAVADAEFVPLGLAAAHYWIYAQYCQLTSATSSTSTTSYIMVDQIARRSTRVDFSAVAGTTVGGLKRADMTPIEVLPGKKLAIRVTAGGEDMTTDDWYCVAFAYMDPN